MLLVLAAAVAVAVGWWVFDEDSSSEPLVVEAAQGEVVLAAGDIAVCGASATGDEATAAILDGQPGTVLTLGDTVYEDGTAAEYANCYAPTWGRHLARTRPSVGNHEYHTPDAAGYFSYFGAAAGDPTRGYYSFDLGAWHLIALNSNCAEVGGCTAGSPQELWLRADLAAHPKTCTLAYWHHPRFNSGTAHGNTAAMQPLWQALSDYGAEIVLSGHEHVYERFAPQTAAGVADPALGVRQFTVGTGGRTFHAFGTAKPNSEVRHTGTFGVLRLDLSDAGYAWQFLPASGTFTDAGSASCHSVDRDGDTHADEDDNCPALANASQADSDSDDVGDACEAGYGTSASDADSDGDGCADGAELWTAAEAGGWRNPAVSADFYDVTGDAAIDLADALLILQHFGHGPSDDALDEALDRRIPAAWEPWRTATANDGVDLVDALNNLQSFGHSCA